MQWARQPSPRALSDGNRAGGSAGERSCTPATRGAGSPSVCALLLPCRCHGDVVVVVRACALRQERRERWCRCHLRSCLHLACVRRLLFRRALGRMTDMAPANDEAMPMATNEEAPSKRMITILSQDKEKFVVEKGVATMATLIEDLLAGTLCDALRSGNIGGFRHGGRVQIWCA